MEVTQKTLLLKMAKEPIFLYGDGSQVRTHEQWVQLSRSKDGYTVSWGNDRGIVNDELCKSLSQAECVYNGELTRDMKNVSKAEVNEENAGLTLENIVRLFGEEGDNIREGVDGYLESLANAKGVRSTYKTLMSRIEDSWVKATVRRGKEKLFVYFEGHMISKIEIA